GRLSEGRLGLGRAGSLEGGEVCGVGPDIVPAEFLECVGELIDGAAIELARGDKLVAWLQQAMKCHHLRGVAGCGRESGSAAFEGCDALLKNRRRWVPDPGVDVAESRQAEQRGGMVDAFKNVGSGLVDRGRASASRRVGLRACVDRKRGKTRDAFAHAPFLWAGPWRYSRRGGRLPFNGPAAGVKAQT